MSNKICLYLILLGLAPCAGHSRQGSFTYLDYANQTEALPLVGCGKLILSPAQNELRIGHFLEGISITHDGKFTSLKSKTLPITIPIVDYDRSISWIFSNRKYIKIARDVKLFPQNERGDVIAVVSDIDKMKGGDTADGPNDRYLIENTKVTFLYSKAKGVLAIALEDSGDSASVYFCASTNCLFAPEEASKQ